MRKLLPSVWLVIAILLGCAAGGIIGWLVALLTEEVQPFVYRVDIVAGFAIGGCLGIIVHDIWRHWPLITFKW